MPGWIQLGRDSGAPADRARAAGSALHHAGRASLISGSIALRRGTSRFNQHLVGAGGELGVILAGKRARKRPRGSVTQRYRQAPGAFEADDLANLEGLERQELSRENEPFGLELQGERGCEGAVRRG